jgi:large subunit ribosomal protein L1
MKRVSAALATVAFFAVVAHSCSRVFMVPSIGPQATAVQYLVPPAAPLVPGVVMMDGRAPPIAVPTGRGDRRTKKGKRFAGSFGKSRPRNAELRKRKREALERAEAEPGRPEEPTVASEQMQVAEFAILGGLTGLFLTLARFLVPFARSAVRAPTETLDQFDPSEFGRLHQQTRRAPAPVMTNGGRGSKIGVRRQRRRPPSKRWTELDESYDKNIRLGIEEGLALSMEKATAKFDETMEFHAKLGLDPKYNDQQLRTTVSLPKGTGKEVRIGVLCEEGDALAAIDAGAVKAGMDDFLEDIGKGDIDIDVLLAVPAAMPKLARYGKVLGPKGLMPSPKAGTVTSDVVQSVKEFLAGKVEIRTDKSGCVHVPFGKRSFAKDALNENLMAVLMAVEKNRPSGSKGKYWQSVSLSSTMGPAVKIDLDVVKKATA